MNAPHPAQPGAPGFEAFDQLATMVALVRADGRCLQANSALENAVGMSRRSLQRGSIFDLSLIHILFSLPSVDHPEYGRHIELGVKGLQDPIEAFAALRKGLEHLSANLGPEMVR